MDKLRNLRRRAAKYGMCIKGNYKGEYSLVDIRLNVVACYPAFMPLEGIENWIDSLDEKAKEEEEEEG